MSKKNISIFLTILSMGLFTSCSVVMAAKKEGTSISKIQRCNTRFHMVSLGGVLINSEKSDDGLIEVYRFKKEKGSTSKAVMHGLLDVSTFGLWEVIGTPIELNKTDEFFTLKVVYDSDENIKDIILN